MCIYDRAISTLAELLEARDARTKFIYPVGLRERERERIKKNGGQNKARGKSDININDYYINNKGILLPIIIL